MITSFITSAIALGVIGYMWQINFLYYPFSLVGNTIALSFLPILLIYKGVTTKNDKISTLLIIGGSLLPVPIILAANYLASNFLMEAASERIWYGAMVPLITLIMGLGIMHSQNLKKRSLTYTKFFFIILMVLTGLILGLGRLIGYGAMGS